ncbi:MAG: hypothetical protein GHHEDOFH_00195 [Pseudorhodoplanes sp.]|nr:hypothetical protein [Pseudorhodoplanes sp.]GIK79501.1 MAG: hypothetical protein BroJett024_06060 [Alphaproteobacteria bacterium]
MSMTRDEESSEVVGAEAMQLLAQEQAAHAKTRQELIDIQRRLDECLDQHKRDIGLIEARFQTALHGARVCVFSQDCALHYDYVSKPLFGLPTDAILGNVDEDILPAPACAPIVAAKREVLATGEPRDLEISIERDGIIWYDVHIEAMRDPAGRIAGLTGAAIDITGRKESEAHLRLLMRELTHRSKNLLAVIQAMARQTAKHAGTTERFLARFGARLQALARSHDLLVQESWYGASLYDLVRSQLGHYIERDNPQVAVDGPTVRLKPEAAQSLGLALHELATNAAKYGALSRARGRVAIGWQVQADGGVALHWIESKGPKVASPMRRGFGSLVIEHNLVRAIEADVELAFEPDGLRCRITIPASQLLEARDALER